MTDEYAPRNRMSRDRLERELDDANHAVTRHMRAEAELRREVAELTEMLTAATDTAIQRGKRIDELAASVAYWQDGYYVARCGPGTRDEAAQ